MQNIVDPYFVGQNFRGQDAASVVLPGQLLTTNYDVAVNIILIGIFYTLDQPKHSDHGFFRWHKFVSLKYGVMGSGPF